MHIDPNSADPERVELTQKGKRYVSAHDWRKDIAAHLAVVRGEAVKEIERLIAIVDEIDGDPDFEPDADSEPGGDEEPSLGWTTTANQAARDRHRIGETFFLDSEAEHDGREPDTDREPNLGAGNASPSLGGMNQEVWADGGDCGEREIEHEGSDLDICGEI